MFMRSVDPCIPLYTDYQYIWVNRTHEYRFRATGGYICGCGRPSNLVWSL